MAHQTTFEKRHDLERLRGQLESERSSFLTHWRELNDFFLPRRGRFWVTENNRGDRRNHRIIDSTGLRAVRTLRAGMMAGITPPSRPWFRLAVPDSQLAELDDVKAWLSIVQRLMSDAFIRSNLYNALPILYGDMGTFGTSAIFIEEDAEETLRATTFPIGSFMISTNARGKVDTFVRDFRMTVRQVVEKFGRLPDDPSKIDWTNLSSHVRGLWESNHTEVWINVTQVVRPNPDWDPEKIEARFKRYESVYYERGASTTGTGTPTSHASAAEGKLLRQSGFDLFPVLAPRWEVGPDDMYGSDCPGMEALGDVKQLQIGERRSLQAIEKMVNPPIQGPASLRNTVASILPGAMTYVDNPAGSAGMRPVHEVNPRVEQLEAKQQQVRIRIEESYFVNLFLGITRLDRRQITAREIEERVNEKLLSLGPVLERLNQDLLDPLIDLTFEFMLRQGKVPPPPEELQGVELKVEYISILAQAQKATGLASIERFAAFVAQAAEIKPEILDKMDLEETIDQLADILAVPPSIVVSDEDVLAIRAERARALQAQRAMENVAQISDTAKTLSQAKTEEGSLLDQLQEQSRAGQLAEPAVPVG